MGHGLHESIAISFKEIDGTSSSPAGRTDGVFTVVLPSIPLIEDEVLVAFEQGDPHHDVDGRDFLTWQRGHNPAADVATETITIVHEGFELM